MEIQDLLINLYELVSQLNDIKLKKVRGELTEREAKKQAAILLKQSQRENVIGKALAEWKE